MGKETGIAWTDHTFNPWWGCTKVSPGCDHCYAETFDKRTGGAHWGKGQPRRVFKPAHWQEPLRWNEAAAKELKRSRVFTASMADIMDDEAPEGQLARLWELIDATPWLYWLLLTKRPQRYERRLPVKGFRHDNVMLGCTAEDSAFYATRWPYVVAAARRLSPISGNGTGRIRTFVSYEPALGPLNLLDAHAMGWSDGMMAGGSWLPDQVIFGGETGPGRRPTDEAWARDLRDQCQRFRVAFFMKQMSAATPKAAADLIPADLLIREEPSRFHN